VHDVPNAVLRLTDSGVVTPGEKGANQGKGVILQPEFSHGRGRIKHLISITPGASHVLSYQLGQFHLARGQVITLKGAVLGYEQDGMVRLRERRGNGTGAVLWEGGSEKEKSPPGQFLTYTAGGKLCITSGDPAQVCFDFTPHIPSHATPGSDERVAPAFIFSDSNPHLSITTPNSSMLFSSSYTFSVNPAFPGGQVVARTYMYGNSPRTVLYTLSPYCQFVVLRSKKPQAVVPALPLAWPAPTEEAQWEWEIVWTTPNPRTKEKRTDAMMYFQGDGNFVSLHAICGRMISRAHLTGDRIEQVIRSQKTVPWASGTSGKTPPATHLRFGLGSVEEPWIEIVNETGGRVWSS
jgi:hypothetical protein